MHAMTRNIAVITVGSGLTAFSTAFGTPIASLQTGSVSLAAGILAPGFGAVALGWIADRYGRKPATLLSFASVGMAVLGLAISRWTESDELALIFSLFQGASIFGCQFAVFICLMESVPREQRGLHVSFLPMAGAVGGCCAGLVLLMLMQWIPAPVPLGWIFGIAICGASATLCFLPLAFFWLSEPAQHEKAATRPWRAALTPSVVILSLLCMCMTREFLYLKFVMETKAATPSAAAQGENLFYSMVVLNGCIALASPIAGWLSDKIGRRSVLLAVGGVFLVSSLVFAFGDFFENAASRILFAVLFSIIQFMTFLIVGYAFPESIRARSLAMAGAVALAVVALMMGGGGRSLMNGEVVLMWAIAFAGLIAAQRLSDIGSLPTISAASE